jgi:uncharacterized UBP type Zn finger protein
MPPASRHEVQRVGQLPCHHVAVTHPIQLHSAGCPECLDRGDDWIELWLCLSCGWVACSDNSPNHHARAHYEETDHPVAAPLRQDPYPRWCYVHQRAV